MESTEKILEKMDGAVFEKLCGQVMRKMIPELTNLIQCGINMDGRTIKSLSDGFCFIDRNHFAVVHITTNASDLKKKWLYNGTSETTPKGDLIKGVNQARALFADCPDYKFSIFLVSNKRVEEDLHIEVNKRIVDDFITLKIIEQRDLVSFLNHDPEGQYLRKCFLGIDADRISVSLLRDIAKDNLFRYSQEIYLEERHLAKISSQKLIESQMSTSTTTINFLAGHSGFGKSTICYAMLRSALGSGGIALRVMPSVVELALSLEDAILKQLMHDYPKLFLLANDVQTLFQDALIVIDDINKSNNSSAILDKVISWNQAKHIGSINVLCPLWERNLNALGHKVIKESKYTVISLEQLSFYDCKAIIQQRLHGGLARLTEQQIYSLIVGTDFDPLLLNFSLQLFSNSQKYTENIASDAIERYVSDIIQQLSKVIQLPVYLISQALRLLAKGMLKTRKLDPNFQDIVIWIDRGSDEYRIIVTLAEQRQLFYFDDTGRCFFRHDRVREYLLTLPTDFFNNYNENEDVLGDPFFAEITGAAIGRNNIQREILQKVIHTNPLAVYLSLKYLQEQQYAQRLNTVIEVIQEWNTFENIQLIPRVVTNAISSALMSFDVKQIQLLTQGFPASAELQLAKFRNGEWLAGVNFFSFIKYFYPEAPAYLWHSILEHVKSKHLNETINGLNTYLPEKFTANGIAHAYTLAGFLRHPELLEALTNSWRKYASAKNYAAYLWAILNSFTKDDRLVVVDALAYWYTIPEEEKAHPLRERLSAKRLGEQLKVLNWGFSDEQLLLLFELCHDSSLQEILALLFTRIDHPLALTVVLNQEIQRDETRQWHDHWDSRWDRSKTWRRLNESSLSYLLQSFCDTNANPMRRFLAWRYWTGNVNTDIALSKLRGIAFDDDSLFEHSVVWRVLHHDHTALESVKHFIFIKPWLVRVLVHIWNEETKAFFESWFIRQLNNIDKECIGFGLELLSLLDNNDACCLLIQHWEKLKFHTRATGTALFLSTSATRALCDKEIRRLGFDPNQPIDNFYIDLNRGAYFSEIDGLSKEKKDNLVLLSGQFKYLSLHYGSKYEGKGERLTRDKLESLLPYLQLFDRHSIFSFAQDCIRIGATELCYERFYPLLGNCLRKRFRLNADDLIEDIIGKYRELEREDKVYIEHWIEDAEKLCVSSDVLTIAVKSFYEEFHNKNAFFIGSTILERLGSRKTIALMDNFILDSEAHRENVEYWKANAIFSIKRRSIN